MRIACMPLVTNIPKPRDRGWVMKKCPVCGCACWESNTLRNSLRVGIIKEAACTECALKAMGQSHD
jgi:hypothetical protein